MTQSASQVSTKKRRSTQLIYISDDRPGIRRVRSGAGFRYVGPTGHKINDARTLDRIRRLAVPPAYTDVWICPDPLGHIQATGRDARRRKQYRYHDDWRIKRDVAKFSRMVEFGALLPKLRRHLKDVLKQQGFPRDKVLAVIITLLDRTRVRIGNEEYARNNKSFGLTTLRNRHVKFPHKGQVSLRFRGKGGVDHQVNVDDSRLAKIVHALQELPGQHLFQYVDDKEQCHPVDSTMVNDYLHAVMGQEFTAKDFRTWNATLRAMDLLLDTPLPSPLSERACKACMLNVIRQVASELRNTPAVCRKSYINPAVFTAWREGHITAGHSKDNRSREKAALRLLMKWTRSAKPSNTIK